MRPVRINERVLRDRMSKANINSVVLTPLQVVDREVYYTQEEFPQFLVSYCVDYPLPEPKFENIEPITITIKQEINMKAVLNAVESREQLVEALAIVHNAECISSSNTDGSSYVYVIEEDGDLSYTKGGCNFGYRSLMSHDHSYLTNRTVVDLPEFPAQAMYRSTPCIVVDNCQDALMIVHLMRKYGDSTPNPEHMLYKLRAKAFASCTTKERTELILKTSPLIAEVLDNNLQNGFDSMYYSMVSEKDSSFHKYTFIQLLEALVK